MDNLFNIPSNAIKTVDKLLQNFREETIDEVEESFKNLKKNFKAGNYLALAMFFIILGISSILSQYFSDNFFLFGKSNSTSTTLSLAQFLNSSF